MKILVVDNDENFLQEIRNSLQDSEFVLTEARNGKEALKLCTQVIFDLVLYSTNIKEMEYELFIELSFVISSSIKVIVISDEHSIDDEISTLQSMAFDYITKPLNYDILKLKFNKASYYNIHGSANTELSCDSIGLNYNLNNNKVTIHGVEQKLSLTELNLLKLFLINKNKVLARKEIYMALWGEYDDEGISSRKIDVHISRLKKKLDIKYISSVHGTGYIWSE